MNYILQIQRVRLLKPRQPPESIVSDVLPKLGETVLLDSAEWRVLGVEISSAAEMREQIDSGETPCHAKVNLLRLRASAD
jgi:hypothetical protein